MKTFSKLISFESGDGAARYFADLGTDESDIPKAGTSIDAHSSFEDLVNGKDKVRATVGKVTSSQPTSSSNHLC